MPFRRVQANFEIKSFNEPLAGARKLWLVVGMTEQITPLERAKKLAGGAAGLSRKLNSVITPQAISQWLHVPAERVLAVSDATGVPPHELRPDVFRAPQAEDAA